MGGSLSTAGWALGTLAGCRREALLLNNDWYSVENQVRGAEIWEDFGKGLRLAVGGRLVAPVMSGERAKQALMVIDKTHGGLRQMVLETVHFVPLKSGIA